MIAKPRTIEHLSLAQWCAFDRRYPAATFFARPAWSQAIASSNPRLAPHPLRVHTAGDAYVVPLMQAAGGTLGWREFVGMPLGGYTYAIRSDGSAATAAEFDTVLKEIGGACDVLTLVPWPLLPAPDLPAGWSAKPHETAAIDLAGGLDTALSGLSGVSRRMAGQAQRRGVVCAPDRSQGAVAAFYDMLCESAQRWGLPRPPYARALLDALVSFGEGDVEIWFARCEDRPIAGGVVFFGSEEVFFWSAAMRRDDAALRPSNALNVALIRAAAQRGMRWYNLGASEGLPGVERFKKGLGAATIPYAELQMRGAAFALFSRLTSTLRYARASAGGV